MAEYFYHKGNIRLRKNRVKEFLDTLTETEYAKEAVDNGEIQVEGDTVTIDTVSGGSYPLSFLKDFEDKLQSCSHLFEGMSEIEHYLFNDGYYKITLDPKSKNLIKKKLSKEDPYKDGKKPTSSEEASATYDLDDLVEVLESRLDESEDAEEIIRQHYEIIKKWIKEGNVVHTPLGSLCRGYTSHKEPITTFMFSELL